MMNKDGSLRHDREWAILDVRTNKILTCREKPCLVRIKPSISTSLVLTFPDGSCAVTSATDRRTFATQLWDVPCPGIDQGDDVSTALSAYLDEPCGTIRLIRMKRCSRRLSDSEKYGALVGSEDVTRFSDWSTLTLVSTATVRALRSHSQLADLDAAWFRPNIVVDAPTPFIEDTWRGFKLDGEDFHVLKRCSRCVELCVNPRTGRFTPGFEPLKTLRRLRGGWYTFLPPSSPFSTREAFAAVNRRLLPQSHAFPIVVGRHISPIAHTFPTVPSLLSTTFYRNP